MQRVTVYYELAGEGEQGWRLLTSTFRERLPVGERQLHILVRAYTFRYQQENMELTDQLDELRMMENEYQLARQVMRQQQFLNDRHQGLPRVTFLYGSPLYKDQPENVFSHPVKYLRPLNSLVGTLRGSQMELRL